MNEPSLYFVDCFQVSRREKKQKRKFTTEKTQTSKNFLFSSVSPVVDHLLPVLPDNECRNKLQKFAEKQKENCHTK